MPPKKRSAAQLPDAEPAEAGISTAGSKTKKVKTKAAPASVSRSRPLIQQEDADISNEDINSLEKRPKSSYRKRGLEAVALVNEFIEKNQIDPNGGSWVRRPLHQQLKKLLQTCPANKTWKIRRNLKSSASSGAAGDVAVVYRTGGCYGFMLAKNESRAQAGPDVRGVTVVGSENFDAQLKEQVGTALENIFNTEAVALTVDNKSFVQQLGILVKSIIVDDAFEVRVPNWTRDGWVLRIPYLSEASGTFEYYQIVRATVPEFDEDYPELPDHITLVSSPPTSGQTGSSQKCVPIPRGEWPDGKSKTNLPEHLDVGKRVTDTLDMSDPAARQKLMGLEKHLVYMSYKLTNLYATKEKMSRLYKNLDASLSRGTFNTQRLVVVFPPGSGYHGLKTHFVPGSSIRFEIVPGKHFHRTDFRKLILNDPRASLAMECVAQAESVYAETDDALRAYFALAEAIDSTNQLVHDGDYVVGCNHSEDQKQSSYHYCDDGCGKKVLCAARILFHDQRYLHPDCYQHKKDEDPGFIQIVKTALRRRHESECKRYGVSSTSTISQDVHAAVQAEIVEYVQKVCPAPKYRCQYTGNKYNMVGNYGPFSQSVEAVHYPHEHQDGTAWGHTKGNTALVALVVQYAKKDHFLIILPEIRKYRAAMRIATSRAAKRSLQRNLLKFFDRVNALERKRDFEMKGNWGKVVDAKQFAVLRSEALSGEFNAGVSEEAKAAWGKVANRLVQSHFEKECAWPEDFTDALLRMVEQWENEFEMKFDRSADDKAPWFGTPGTMPDAWSFDELYSFCVARMWRLQNICNKLWETVDSDQGLACEIFYQRAIQERGDDCRPLTAVEMKYADDFLSLPFSGDIGNVSMVSIGHATHGLQMRLGWTLEPRSMQDRTESLNNVLIETTFSNSAKFSWDPAIYPMILSYFDSVDIDEQFLLTPSAQQASYEAVNVPTVEELDNTPRSFLKEDILDQELADKLSSE
ncbi:hypothetical protein M409DRAFT_50638 [Zasmidium cellare ATCC 36951]|uniref:Uncharacterized protein n=1 Tax=Zasmidium cellare ATCC 36951 TaxID=1080233 RepID=A0A6A6CZ65_ZASCE|nr:uncharacterized protein M409DRAFT_50638 [Zasmidium cellare ATCC 36951]KAF2172043.1 hypothetical protein M409DRAFT_50638 [Zasmidium cellare ATCC 36951]